MGLGILGTILLVVAGMIAVVMLPFVLWKFFKGVGWLVTHLFTFIGGMLGDSLRLVGGVITTIVFLPLVVANIAIGRWSASKHYWRGFQDEVVGCGHCVYRLAIGHPARLLMLTPLTEGLEKRIPEAIAQAPTSDRPPRRVGTFDGYTITGSLKGGGSGGKLYIARPDKQKHGAFVRRGHHDIGTVVIKSFSLQDGSTLPQIIRESRALEAARDLGLVLDHELTGERFYYVMPYVPGDSLSAVTERLHTRSNAEGLSREQLALGLGYISDLLSTLERYHAAGLWHKDIKPDNIIVGPDGRAHLVDLGLVTPLRSAMTLTTHGTEYFRDPELVRLALRGVKVHEVDGVKFDIYGAGACLYALVERSFPAHGGLSQISRQCPEALRWITRRSMADIEQRYASANDMLADLEFVRQAPDPFAVKPADLPSMRGGEPVEPAPVAEPVSFTPPARSPVPPPPVTPVTPVEAPAYAPPKQPTRVRVMDWWTGKYRVENAPQGAGAAHQHRQQARVVPADLRRPAADQLRHARERVASAQARASVRMQGRAGHAHRHSARSGARDGARRAFWPMLFIMIFLGAAGMFLLVPTSVSISSSGRSSGTAITMSSSGAPLMISDAEKSRTMRMNTEQLAYYMGDTIGADYVLVDPSDALRSEDTEAKRFVDDLLEAGVDLDVLPGEETEAQLRAIIGTSLPGDDETTLEMLRWLDEGYDYEGILWIGSSGSGSEEAPTWQLIYAGEAPEPDFSEMIEFEGTDEADIYYDGAWLDGDWWDELGTWHGDAEEVVQDILDDVGEALDEAADEVRGAAGARQR